MGCLRWQMIQNPLFVRTHISWFLLVLIGIMEPGIQLKITHRWNPEWTPKDLLEKHLFHKSRASSPNSSFAQICLLKNLRMLKTDKDQTPTNLTYQRIRRTPYGKTIKCLLRESWKWETFQSLFPPHCSLERRVSFPRWTAHLWWDIGRCHFFNQEFVQYGENANRHQALDKHWVERQRTRNKTLVFALGSSLGELRKTRATELMYL